MVNDATCHPQDWDGALLLGFGVVDERSTDVRKSLSQDCFDNSLHDPEL
jgi:hypothetical protein